MRVSKDARFGTSHPRRALLHDACFETRRETALLSIRIAGVDVVC